MPPRRPLHPALLHEPFSIHDPLLEGASSKRLRSPDLSIPVRGVRISAAAAPTVYTRCKAMAFRLREGEVFGAATAALLWGIPLPAQYSEALHGPSNNDSGSGSDAGHASHPPAHQPLHVAAPRHLRASRANGIRGFNFSRPGGHGVLRFGLPTADAASTWLQLASLLTLDDLVAAGDHLVRVPEYQQHLDPRPYCSLEQLAQACSGYIGTGKSLAAKAISLVREGSDSRPESHLRLLLHRARLPSPELNPVISDRFGARIGRADIVFRDARLIVEYDGDQHRTSTLQYERDITRVSRFNAEDWHVTRVRRHGLYFVPKETAATITSLYRARVGQQM